jgi:hypothetical protein
MLSGLDEFGEATRKPLWTSASGTAESEAGESRPFKKIKILLAKIILKYSCEENLVFRFQTPQMRPSARAIFSNGARLHYSLLG